MQKFLRRTESPFDLFVWTTELSKQDGFEEVWAADASDAAKSPAAPKLDTVGRSDLPLLDKKTLCAYAAFRLNLEIDPGKESKGSVIEKICASQGWEVPEPEAPSAPKAAPKPVLKPTDDPEVVEAIAGAAAAVAKGSVTDGQAAVLTMMNNGNFLLSDPFTVAKAIDDKAMELLSAGKTADAAAAEPQGDSGAGEPADSSSPG